MRRFILALFVVAASICLLTSGELDLFPALRADPVLPANQAPVIRVNSNLVTVPVSVTDSNGRLVRDLQAYDFSIEENGKSEPIARMAEPGKTPLDLALLFDISGSLIPGFDFEKQAGSLFLQKIMRPEDSVSIFSIAAEPHLILSRSESLASALEALDSLSPTRGATAFYDAVVMAGRFLQKNVRPQARRVELALTDGEDNSSAISEFTDMANEVLKNDCVFYSINPAGASVHLNKISQEGQEILERLASETGGVAFVPETIAKLDAIFDQIAAELQAQYLLEYYSSGSQGEDIFRRIVVRVPARPDLRIRSRQGYYAPKSLSRVK